MALAAIRNLATKIRIPGPSALQALRAPGPNAIAPHPSPPPPPTDDLKCALALKDSIESAGPKELLINGNLIEESCEVIEEKLTVASDLHVRVARSLRNVALRCFFTGVVLSSIHNTIESYYYVEDAFAAVEGRLAAEEPRLSVEEPRLSVK